MGRRAGAARCIDCRVVMPDRSSLQRGRCPACSGERAAADALRSGLRLLGLTVLAVVVLAVTRPAAPWDGLWWTFALLVPVSGVMVAAHEAAHAVVARLLGMDVPLIRVGVGSTLATTAIGRTRVQWSMIPIAGFTLPLVRSPRLVRARLALVILAGPLASGAQALLAARWTTESVPGHALQSLLVGTGLMGLANLLPMRLRGSTPGGSDGWLLLHLPRLTHDELLASNEASRVMASIETGALEPEPASLADLPEDAPGERLGIAALTPLLAERWAEAIALLRSAASRPHRRAEDHALTRNNLAWALVMSGDPGVLAEADEASAAAIDVLPWQPAVRNTRGVVLVALGRPGEGRDLLRSGVARGGIRPNDEAHTRCWLARAEHECGNLAGARGELLAIEHLDPSHSGLAALRRELADDEVRNTLSNLLEPDERVAWPAAGDRSPVAAQLDEVRRALHRFVEDEARPVHERAAVVRSAAPPGWQHLTDGALLARLGELAGRSHGRSAPAIP